MTLAPGIDLPLDAISELCRRYGVRELSAFGSAARGDKRPDSAVDVLVSFDSIDRELLMEMIEQRIADRRILRLIRK